jgi:alkylhydroperoxidase family enzyme
MRLTPISNPKPIIIKIAYYFSKRKLGKVLSPLRVIYSRSVPIFSVATKIISADKKLSLDRDVILLIRNYVSNLNECKFCSNIIEYMSKEEKYKLQKIKELLNFRNSSVYSPCEKAVLKYVEEISLSKSATQETYDELKNYFNEKEIIEITWVCASENYFNMQAKPLGLSSDELRK